MTDRESLIEEGLEIMARKYAQGKRSWAKEYEELQKRGKSKKEKMLTLEQFDKFASRKYKKVYEGADWWLILASLRGVIQRKDADGDALKRIKEIEKELSVMLRS